MTENYRPELDSLRAIAVMGVLAFHWFPEYLPGGFIGVDIFFVLSGFLITNNIYGRSSRRQFSFLSFYSSRLKRLMPAYFLMLMTTVFVAAFVFPPGMYAEVAKSAESSVFYISNLYFYFSASYFSIDSHFIPLLHTWSLSVEEQFYIFWPMFLVFVASRFRHGTILLMFALIGTALIPINYWISLRDPSLGFYFPLVRALEFLVGAICVFIPSRFLYLCSVSSMLSAFAVLGSVFGLLLIFFQFSDSTPFPGVYVLIPCLLTAVYICFSNYSLRGLLGCKILTFVGKLSYSLYLWHWPVYVFYSFYRGGVLLIDYVAILVITVFFSLISYALFEQRLRYLNFSNSKVFLLYMLVPSAFVLMLGYFFVWSKVTWSEEVLAEDASVNNNSSKFLGACHSDKDSPALVHDCEFVLGDGDKKYLLVGDSHAAHFYPFLTKYLKDGVLEVQTMSSCPPLLGVHKKNQPDCFNRNEFLRKKIESGKYEKIFFGGYWGNELLYSQLYQEAGDKIGYEAMLTGVASFAELALHYNSLPVLLKQVPVYGVDVGVCVMREKLNVGKCNPGDAEPGPDKFYGDLKSLVDDIAYIDAFEFVCSPKCAVELSGVPLYHDKHHLNYDGSLLLGKLYKSLKPDEK